MKKAISVIILVILVLILTACDKNTMYATSQHSLEKYLQRYEEIEKKVSEDKEGQFSDIDEKMAEIVFSIYAASNYSYKEFWSRMEKSPNEQISPIYAYSKHTSKAFQNRLAQAEKYKLEQYNVEKGSMMQGIHGMCFAGSEYSIDKYIERIKLGKRHFDNDAKIACFAMSKNDIEMFKKKLKEIEEKG